MLMKDEYSQTGSDILGFRDRAKLHIPNFGNGT